MNTTDYEILVNSMPGNERPPDFAVKLLEDTCERTGLDWKMRHAYLMKRGGKWAVTLSIDGFRLIGAQNPEYAGQEGPFWVTSANGQWTDIPPDGAIYAAKVGIKHRDGTTTWGVAKFKDYAAGPMWTKFPSTMIAKCAEMLAWRKAMPGQLGGLYGTEEMAQASAKSGPKQEPQNTGSGPTNGSDTSVPSEQLLTEYTTLLDSAPTRAEVIRVGAKISADKRLSTEHLNTLHQKYKAAKEGKPD